MPVFLFFDSISTLCPKSPEISCSIFKTSVSLIFLLAFLVALFGFDMHYPKIGKTHFYGKGTADPLREDISLMSLKAKSNRFLHISQKENCLVGNLSDGPSKLTFPRVTSKYSWPKVPSLNDDLISKALQREKDLNYFDVTGRYWQNLDKYNVQEIKKLDDIWDQILS